METIQNSYMEVSCLNYIHDFISMTSRCILRTHPVSLEYIKTKLNNEESQRNIIRFIEDGSLNILFIQISLSNVVNENLSQEDHTRQLEPECYAFFQVTEINQNNILLIVFIKNESIKLTIDNFYEIVHLHHYYGIIKENMYFMLWNSFKPVIDNFIKSDTKNRSILSQIIRSYSEFDRSLLELKEQTNIHKLKLKIHPEIERICETKNNISKEELDLTLLTMSKNTELLGDLYRVANYWCQDCDRAFNYEIDPFESESCLYEEIFWKNKKIITTDILNDLSSEPVRLSLEILSRGNRRNIITVVDKISSTNKLTQLPSYIRFMETLNLLSIFTSITLEELVKSVERISECIGNYKKYGYPSSRLICLSAVIARDINKCILKILTNSKTILFEGSSLHHNVFNILEIYKSWSGAISIVLSFLKQECEQDEFIKIHRRYNEFLDESLSATYSRVCLINELFQTNEHITEISDSFRAWIINNKNKNSEVKDDQFLQSLQNIKQDWANFINSLNFLDFSNEGKTQWDGITTKYKGKISNIDKLFVKLVQNYLSIASSDQERIDIFVQFKKILQNYPDLDSFREFQVPLAKRLLNSIIALKTELSENKNDFWIKGFMKNYNFNHSSLVLFQKKRAITKLKQYLFYLTCIFGPKFKCFDISQQIMNESFDLLYKKYHCDSEISPFTQTPISQLKNKSLFYYESIVNQNNTEILTVNFPSHLIKSAFEFFYSKCLDFKFKGSYHSALTVERFNSYKILDETLRTFQMVKNKLVRNQNNMYLLSPYLDHINAMILRGISYYWESSQVYLFSKRFNECVVVFCEKVDIISCLSDIINSNVELLNHCSYDHEIIHNILVNICKNIQLLHRHSVFNLDFYVNSIENDIKKILTSRLQSSIILFIKMLSSSPFDCELTIGTDYGIFSHLSSTTDPSSNTFKPQFLNLEIKSDGHTIVASPSLFQVRSHLYSQLQLILSIVTNQKRIKYYDNYVIDGEKPSPEYTYSSLLNYICVGENILSSAYKTMDKLYHDISTSINYWLSYQSLWDIHIDSISKKIDTIDKWIEIIQDFELCKTALRNTKSSRIFPFVIVIYNSVKSLIFTKYDEWETIIFDRFTTKYNENIEQVISMLQLERKKIENYSVETSTTEELINILNHFEVISRNLSEWKNTVSVFVTGQKILDKLKFELPSGWIYADNLDGEWNLFLQLYNKTNQIITAQHLKIQLKISGETQTIIAKAEETLQGWDKDKPTSNELDSERAQAVVSHYSILLNKYINSLEGILKAKEVLKIQHSKEDSSYVVKLKLQNAIEELNDLNKVWTEVAIVIKILKEVREIIWISLKPEKLIVLTKDLITKLNQFPVWMRQFSCYTHLQDTLESLSKMNVLICDLKSECFKERHWNALIKKFNANFSYLNVTIGQLWDIDLIKNNLLFQEVWGLAQGELALEKFLSNVSDNWESASFTFITFKNKCSIVTNWNDLFSKLLDHLNSLNSMKSSPYYKYFESQCQNWETKLTCLLNLTEIWVELQRKWIYLDGIFSDSSDISKLLSMETNKFSRYSNEYISMLRKVVKIPNVLTIFDIPDILTIFQNLLDNLSQIQKVLGQYLEKEREHFPRFYFIGDDDLLEILGNSSDIILIQKHLKKMFPGVSNLLFSANQDQIIGIKSKEQEKLVFHSPIDLKLHSKVIEWLKELDLTIKVTLALLLKDSVNHTKTFSSRQIEQNEYSEWLIKYPQQIVLLSEQIWWCQNIEDILSMNNIENNEKVKMLNEKVLALILHKLNIIPQLIRNNDDPLIRRKMINLITTLVYFRDKTRSMTKRNIHNIHDFEWLSTLRCFYTEQKSKEDSLKSCVIKVADAEFLYGFEYLGAIDYIIQTPLIENCFLVMTQALKMKLGGSPFGPAGTGKTESVKALGAQLGKFVIVFNCDENFDFQAMGRIFIGLCRVGAWGCFDEFNRLEERIISAVSQQIQSIQLSLKESIKKTNEPIMVELLGLKFAVNPDVSIFITMNPDYAGRSKLPNNLKRLFRSFAMTQPDRQLIAQVILYSQGFTNAEVISQKIVPMLTLCSEQLSSQNHYDFGLRSLKSILVTAGNVKRRTQKTSDDSTINSFESEQDIIIQSVKKTLLPKLISEDRVLLISILNDLFPGMKEEEYTSLDLISEVKKCCTSQLLLCANTPDEGSLWLEKLTQLNEIIEVNHGVMLVGPSCSGKSTCWKVLLECLNRLDNITGHSYIIDPKAVSKEILYGYLDINTREWTDGILTSIIRKIIENANGELDERHWIIMDGDVDPEWVENLNSVLDDNKLLTLPNGERLALPPNVRIIFEVSDLLYATPATVSRCGMIYFSEETITMNMLLYHMLNILEYFNLDNEPDENPFTFSIIGKDPYKVDYSADRSSLANKIQHDVVNILKPYCMETCGVVQLAVQYCKSEIYHCMDFNLLRSLQTLFTLLSKTIRSIIIYSRTRDTPLSLMQLNSYIRKYLVFSLVWSFVGDSHHLDRLKFCEYLLKLSFTESPSNLSEYSLLDYYVTLEGKWKLWNDLVTNIIVQPQQLYSSDLFVPTIDTVRNSSLISDIIKENRSIILCGPPGSGKTMTMYSVLPNIGSSELINVNFSTSTSPESLIQLFSFHCKYIKGAQGYSMCPISDKYLLFFFDEINLPEQDKYGTQRVVSFIRQLIECNGFYRPSDRSWIKLEKIKFVGACNPSSDVGRKTLINRFMRHTTLIYVDYPQDVSLFQIYGTLNQSYLRQSAQLKSLVQSITSTMITLYTEIQREFTHDKHRHYVFSPRDLTRWVRGLVHLIGGREDISVEQFIRMLAHEGMRIFQDRMVTESEKSILEEKFDQVIMNNFANISHEQCLVRPIIFSDWLSLGYSSVSTEDLLTFLESRLSVYCQEETDSKLVFFSQLMQVSLCIDRVLKQTQGHLLLIGKSGSGRKTMLKFVTWLNGVSAYKINIHKNYKSANFDEDLRIVLKRAACQNEQIALIIDESCITEPAFLERINSLLSNGDVPNLFQGEEFTTLMSQLNEASVREGKSIEKSQDLYNWFVSKVLKNFHLIFIIEDNLKNWSEKVSTSPALFNRCVIKWCGNWSNQSLCEVAASLISTMTFSISHYECPSVTYICPEILDSISHTNSVIHSIVSFHLSFMKLRNVSDPSVLPSPKKYLDFINQFRNVLNNKRESLEHDQLHISAGLTKIQETVEEVAILKENLFSKRKDLEEQNKQANIKLQLMIKEQENAEKNRSRAIVLQKDLEIKTAEMESKKLSVMSELDKVEPLIKEAKDAVSSIKKQQLVELRSMINPPPMVKLALTSICEMLSQPINEWKVIRSFIMRDDFINSIMNFSTDLITEELATKMQKYLTDPDYTFEKVNRSSQVCGPLIKWVIAQVSYSDILRKVDPLRKELISLEGELEKSSKLFQQVSLEISELEKRIVVYKDEYAHLIRAIEETKATLSIVEKKVTRSENMLSNLKSEQTRWLQSKDGFGEKMKLLIGNCLLCAAFLVYSGNLDQISRQFMWQSWCAILEEVKIEYDCDLLRVEYLSTPNERISWTENELPADYLCMENATILKWNKSVPLIIDPSGQAIAFLVNINKAKKPIKTSFLSNSFRKQLESAIRFGNTIFINDVEFYDPIVNNILDNSVKRVGSRNIVHIAGVEIDLSPSFSMYLFTNDQNIVLPAELSSKICVINFTVTFSGLESQCLYQVIKSERPEIEQKRVDLTKLQGEYLLRLYTLENKLLDVLNEAQGGLLDDDRVISTLEILNKEALEINLKVEDSKNIFQEVNTVLELYKPLSTVCSTIYFTLLNLGNVNSLYQYSLNFFMEMFNCLLQIKRPEVNYDPIERRNILIKNFFIIVTEKVIYGLLKRDKMLFMLLLTKIYIKNSDSSDVLLTSIDHLADSRSIVLRKQKSFEFPSYAQEVQTELNRLLVLKQFSSSAEKLNNLANELQTWASSTKGNQPCPIVWEIIEGVNEKLFTAINTLLLCNALCPNDAHIYMARMVQSVFGEELFQYYYKELNFKKVVCEEVQGCCPILLFSVPGYDASAWIDDLIENNNKKGASTVAMGSVEGCTLADRAISSCSKSGNWLVLKNVHLVTYWIKDLEKKLQAGVIHKEFRLFLTAETNSNFPINIIKMSRSLLFEPPPGVKASLLRTFNLLPESRFEKPPFERSKLYFILAWFHALVTERLRYSSLGWTKTYEFSEADLRVSCDMIDSWVDMVAGNRSNLPPHKLPWEAIRSLLATCIYGSYVENIFDKKLIYSFINNLFDPSSYSSDKQLFSSSDSTCGDICIPSCIKQNEYITWVNNLPNQQSPEWLKLPNNAENLLNISNLDNIIRNFIKVKELDFSSELRTENIDLGGLSPGISTAYQFANTWLSSLPKELAANIKDICNDPITRFYARELSFANSLLSQIIKDLNDVLLLQQRSIKINNRLNSIINSISKGYIPESWRKYQVPNSVSLFGWMSDFASRIEQTSNMVAKLSDNKIESILDIPIKIGKFFFPEAYSTAFRQYVAHTTNVSLEKLVLKVSVSKEVDISKKEEFSSFKISGLKIFGAEYNNNLLDLSSNIMTDLPIMQMEWTWDKTEDKVVPDVKSVDLPVYLDYTRKMIMFTINFSIDLNEKITYNDFYHHGVAIVANHYES